MKIGSKLAIVGWAAVAFAAFVACDEYDSFSRDLGETCEETVDCMSYYVCEGGICTDGSGSGSGGGAGDDCSSSGCCSDYTCVTNDYRCAASCSTSSQCNSNCCVATDGGNGVCWPPGVYTCM